MSHSRPLLIALISLTGWAAIEGLIVSRIADEQLPLTAAWLNIGVLAPAILITSIVGALLLSLWRRLAPARALCDLLRSPAPSSALPAIALLLTTPLALTAAAAATVWLGQTLLDSIKTPALTVTTIVLLWGALSLTALAALPLLYLPALALLRRLAPAHISPLHALTALATLSLLAALATSIALRHTVALLPWWIVASPMLSLLLIAAPLITIKPRRTKLPAAALSALLLALGALAYNLPPPLQHHRAIWAGQTSLANLWGEELERLTDWDDDGASALLGGGDCAPHNPLIHPTANDLPNNRVDEDCDGIDLHISSLALPRGQHAHPRPPQAPTKPHIILITTDALSYRHTSPGGYKHDVTPNLKKLSQRAITFENAFSASSSTRLSLPALLTGKFNSQLQLEDKRIHPYGWSPNTLTLAEQLQQHGWNTVQIVSDNYFKSSNWPGYQQGFQNIITQPTKHAKDKHHTAPEVTDEAIKIIRSEHLKPLFLWTHYYDHHAPYVSPYEPDSKKGIVEHYDDEVRFADQHWGRLFEAIEARWRPEEYILIFTADHGETFYGQYQHGTNIDTAVLDIPFIVQTHVQRGTTRTGLVSQLDLLPTLSNLLNIKPDPEWLGESLLPVIFGDAEPEKEILFSLHYIPEAVKNKKDAFFMIGARTKDWYYVEELRKRQQRLMRWSPEKVDVIVEGDAHTQTSQDLRYTTLQQLTWLRARERALKRPEAP